MAVSINWGSQIFGSVYMGSHYFGSIFGAPGFFKLPGLRILPEVSDAAEQGMALLTADLEDCLRRWCTLEG